MSTLNLETFNNILFGALKDNSPMAKIKMLEAEISMVADVFMNEVAELLDELDKSGYKSPQFQKIQNIKNNTEGLVIELQKLKKEAGIEDEAD